MNHTDRTTTSRPLINYEVLPTGEIMADCDACGEFLPITWMSLDESFLCAACVVERVNIAHGEALECERCANCGHTLGEHYRHYNNFCEAEYPSKELSLTWRGKVRGVEACECAEFKYKGNLFG